MRPIEEIACGLWPTPTARDWRSESASPEFYAAWAANPKGKTLPMMLALWATPTSLAPAKNGNNEAGNSAGLVAIRAHAMAMWPTAAAADAHKGAQKYTPDKGMTLAPAVYHHLGSRTLGSSATTEKPGALNPEFVCWLMGFPPEWDACAPTAMQSSRRLRPK
jgi:hypothetical protein